MCPRTPSPRRLGGPPLVPILAAAALLLGGLGSAHAQRPAAANPPAALTPPPQRTADAFAWLRPAAARLTGRGIWPTEPDLGAEATIGDLNAVLSANRLAVPPTADPSAPLTFWAAHVRVVRALGLRREQAALARIATADGIRLRIPRNFGAEILVRELGLVVNHPAAHDAHERGRAQRMRLADLVHLGDRLSTLSPWQIAALARYRDITLPVLDPARRATVEAAFAQVGRPYIWGGDWPGVRSPWGPQGAAGFDCSGLVWWTYKGAPATRALPVGERLRGRTADDMAHEDPAGRIAPATARAGDLIFFGPSGDRSTRGAISHMAIALGEGWIIHSSGSRAGVSLSHLDSYWPSGIAWARRAPGLI